MKITINLEYPIELVEAFAKSENIGDEPLDTFVADKLTAILVDKISLPFKENTRKAILAKAQNDLVEAESQIDEQAKVGITVDIIKEETIVE